MNRYLQLLIVVISVSLAYAYLDEKDFGEKLLPLSKQWHEKCMFITGITTASIEAMRIGNFGDEIAVKRYVLCLWLVSDLITVKNKRLTLNKELMKDLVPVKMVNGFQLSINCTIEADKSENEPHEKTWALTKCIHKANPETFVMF
ncbi:hypothetical protein JTB14_032375 [Gonioctena quinquepunctata]|nr:hypothetical protein JTB14_032375 [Gonioctena quinquepunctata]